MVFKPGVELYGTQDILIDGVRGDVGAWTFLVGGDVNNRIPDLILDPLPFSIPLSWDGTDSADWMSAHWEPGPVVPGGGKEMVVGSGVVNVTTDLGVSPGAALSLDISGGCVNVVSGGTLAVTGEVNVGAGGTLGVEFVGLRSDALVCGGVVSLGAEAFLDISTSGSALAFGDSMTIISAGGGLSGIFKRVSGVLHGVNRAFAVTYQPDGVTVTVVRPGDFEVDGDVDFSDFTYLAANYNLSGKSWVDGDANGDGAVGFGDFTYLAANYGRSDFDSSVAEASVAGIVELRVDVVTGEMWLVGDAVLSGYSITSAVGSLIPDGDGDAEKFQVYLSNLSVDVSAVSLGVGVDVDGLMSLDAGYDSSELMDLEFRYGLFGQGADVTGNVVVVPEPMTLSLVVFGLGVFAGRRRKKT